MSQITVRKCSTCNSEQNWNYCCKLSIKNYISQLERDLDHWKYSQGNNQNELIILKSKSQFATLNLEYQTMKAFIVGVSLTYIFISVFAFFQ